MARPAPLRNDTTKEIPTACNATKRQVAERMKAVDPEGYALFALLAEKFNARAVELECDGLRWTDERR